MQTSLPPRAAAVLGLLLPSVTIAQAAGGCATGVHIIVAHTITERPAPGVIGAVADDVMAQIPGSDIASVDYPSTLQNYVNSQSQGRQAMADLVNQYAARCPQSKMVLMGYSQGAHVAADVAYGVSEIGFPAAGPLAPATAAQISAIVLTGDPSHVAAAPFNLGTTRNNGPKNSVPRQNSAAYGDLVPRIASFCNSGDTYCDSGNSRQVHLSYVQTNGQEATRFVVNQVTARAAAPVPA